MKKRLEADLISIAHRILQLKNKSDINLLHLETQKLYEKLSVLRFVDNHFGDLKPTIGHPEIEKEIETIFYDRFAPATENTNLTDQKITVESAEVPLGQAEIIVPIENVEGNNGNGNDNVNGNINGNVNINVNINDNEDKDEDEDIDEDEDNYSDEEDTDDDEDEDDEDLDEDKGLDEDEDEDNYSDKEDEDDEENEEEHEDIEKDINENEDNFGDNKETVNEPVRMNATASEPALEMTEETRDTPPKKPEPIQISFEDLLGVNYSETLFVKVDEIEDKTTAAETPKEIVLEGKASRTTPEITLGHLEPRSASLNDMLSKGIDIDLNDRIAFVKHLFGNSNEDYNRVMNQLITFDSYRETRDFIEDMVKPDYNNWEGKDDYAHRFMEIIEKKFL